MKLCGACKTEKHEREFHALPHTSDGLNWRCIECQRAYNREYSLAKTLGRCNPQVLSAFKSAPIARLRRFATKIRVTETCWEWTGNLHPDSGYGRIWFDRRDDRLAHRVAYEWARGPIPNDRVIDHLCRNRACVNPAHMEVVTNVENVMRGESVWATNARKTHCLRGHAFTPGNTAVHNGMRHCRECSRIRKREQRHATASKALSQ